MNFLFILLAAPCLVLRHLTHTYLVVVTLCFCWFVVRVSLIVDINVACTQMRQLLSVCQHPHIETGYKTYNQSTLSEHNHSNEFMTPPTRRRGSRSITVCVCVTQLHVHDYVHFNFAFLSGRSLTGFKSRILFVYRCTVVNVRTCVSGMTDKVAAIRRSSHRRSKTGSGAVQTSSAVPRKNHL